VLTGKGVTAWQRALASLTIPGPAPPGRPPAAPGQAADLPALAAVALAGPSP